MEPLSSYLDTALDCARPVMDWAEGHSGLGGWVGAIGSIVAIFVAWFLVRHEYRRDKRREAARLNAEIDLMVRILENFEAFIQEYVSAVNEKDPEARDYEIRNTNKAP